MNTPFRCYHLTPAPIARRLFGNRHLSDARGVTSWSFKYRGSKSRNQQDRSADHTRGWAEVGTEEGGTTLVFYGRHHKPTGQHELQHCPGRVTSCSHDQPIMHTPSTITTDVSKFEEYRRSSAVVPRRTAVETVSLSTRNQHGTTLGAVEEESGKTSSPLEPTTVGRDETAGRSGRTTLPDDLPVRVGAFNTTTYWNQNDTTTTTQMIRRPSPGTTWLVPRAVDAETGGGAA
jgi:hypothetical protein